MSAATETAATAIALTEAAATAAAAAAEAAHVHTPQQQLGRQSRTAVQHLLLGRAAEASQAATAPTAIHRVK